MVLAPQNAITSTVLSRLLPTGSLTPASVPNFTQLTALQMLHLEGSQKHKSELNVAILQGLHQLDMLHLSRLVLLGATQPASLQPHTPLTAWLSTANSARRVQRAARPLPDFAALTGSKKLSHIGLHHCKFDQHSRHTTVGATSIWQQLFPPGGLRQYPRLTSLQVVDAEPELQPLDLQVRGRMPHESCGFVDWCAELQQFVWKLCRIAGSGHILWPMHPFSCALGSRSVCQCACSAAVVSERLHLDGHAPPLPRCPCRQWCAHALAWRCCALMAPTS